MRVIWIKRVAMGVVIALGILFVYVNLRTEPVSFPDSSVIEINAYSFGFAPSKLVLKKGSKYEILIHNKDVEHTFVVDELGINSTIPAKSSTKIEIIPLSSGTFNIYCNISGHREQGMQGKITITEP